MLPLPEHPDGLPWPTNEWPRGDPPVDVEPLLDELFDNDGPLATTYAAVIVHRGRLIAERYAGELSHLDRSPEPVTADTRLLSWSMAKSFLHALVGMLVGDGVLDTAQPALVPGWEDDRRHITLEQLLCMRDGLDFLEDYVDSTRSDVIEMLFGEGAADTAAFAADRPLAAAPGERFNYSSGTSNIVSGIVARAVGAGEPYQRFLETRLFEPLGLDATATFDLAGTWIASSYVYCRAQDFARFGYLYLRDGVWEGQRLLPEGWVDHGRRVRSFDPDGPVYYGAHWWVMGDEFGSFRAAGTRGSRHTWYPRSTSSLSASARPTRRATPSSPIGAAA